MTEERFEELLGSVLEEKVGVVPRTGLEGRVQARLRDGVPERRGRWGWVVAWGGALVLGVVAARMAGWQDLRTAGPGGSGMALQTEVRQEPLLTQPREGAVAERRGAGHRAKPTRERRAGEAERPELEPLGLARLEVAPLAMEELHVPKLAEE